MTYVLAFYEIDRAWGGPEEGGWWYDTGTLVRPFRVVRSKERAYHLAARANRLITRLQRNKRSVGSVIYDGGRYACKVFSPTAPEFYPPVPPHYE